MSDDLPSRLRRVDAMYWWKKQRQEAENLTERITELHNQSQVINLINGCHGHIKYYSDKRGKRDYSISFFRKNDYEGLD